jgi:multiple sugar transport system permease protein
MGEAPYDGKSDGVLPHFTHFGLLLGRWIMRKPKYHFRTSLARNGWVIGFTFPTVLVIALVLIYPIYFLISASFMKYDILRPQAATFIGLSNFIKLLNNRSFVRSALNTLYFTGGALLIEIFVGTLIGISVSSESRGTNILRGILLIPMMITPVITVYIAKMMLDPTFGLVNYFLGFFGIKPIGWLGDRHLAMPVMMAIDSWIASPFVIFSVVAAIMSVSQEPFEAAKIDGATEFQSTRYILLPMISRIILICAVLRIMGLMKIFDIVYVGTGGGPGDATEVVNLWIFQTALQSFNIGLASAMAVVIMLIFAVICVVYVRLTRVLD